MLLLNVLFFPTMLICALASGYIFCTELKRHKALRSKKKLLGAAVSGLIFLGLLLSPAFMLSVAAALTQQMLIYLVLGALFLLASLRLRKSQNPRLKALSGRLMLYGFALLSLVAYLYFLA